MCVRRIIEEGWVPWGTEYFLSHTGTIIEELRYDRRLKGRYARESALLILLISTGDSESLRAPNLVYSSRKGLSSIYNGVVSLEFLYFPPIPTRSFYLPVMSFSFVTVE